MSTDEEYVGKSDGDGCAGEDKETKIEVEVDASIKHDLTESKRHKSGLFVLG